MHEMLHVIEHIRELYNEFNMYLFHAITGICAIQTTPNPFGMRAVCTIIDAVESIENYSNDFRNRLFELAAKV